MRSVIRNILAVVVGFVAGSAVMMAVESVNGRLLYPELGRLVKGVTDREALRGLMASAPLGALLAVVFGWAFGSSAGGWVAAVIGKQGRVRLALVLGGLLSIAGIANNLMIPPPLWFWIVGLVVLTSAAWVGARLARGVTLLSRAASCCGGAHRARRQ